MPLQSNSLSFFTSFLKNRRNTRNEANILPRILDAANTTACHPNLPKLFIIKLLDPIERPKIKSNKKMVNEVVFSTFCRNFKLRNR